MYAYNCLINERIGKNEHLRLLEERKMKEVELRIVNDDGVYWSCLHVYERFY